MRPAFVKQLWKICFQKWTDGLDICRFDFGKFMTSILLKSNFWLMHISIKSQISDRYTFLLKVKFLTEAYFILVWGILIYFGLLWDFRGHFSVEISLDLRGKS